MINRRFCVILLTFAAVLRADQIDDIVRAEMAQQHIPGVAIGVIKDGRLIRATGYGVASIELNVPVTPKSVFKIGSLSKQFLAAGLMILVQDGKVRLDDKMSKYIDDAPPAWSAITLRHLLSHTSGLTREGPAFNPFKRPPDMEIIRSAYSLPLEFTTGDAWRYSNVGYFSIAEILARVSGESWGAFMDRRVFRPLGMSSTLPTNPADVVPNRAEGYQWNKDKFERALEYQSLRPSGAFLSSIEDMAKWDAALETATPLTKESRERMWTAVPLNNQASSAYGLGWEVQTRGGKRSVHHGGSLSGFKSHYARFPDEHLSFVVLTNADQANPSRILWKIAATWLPGVDQGPASGRPAVN